MQKRTWTNETGLVAHIWKAVKEKYPSAWLMKVHGGPMQQAGVPDLLMCVNGMLVGAEAKDQKPGESEEHARERATPLQRIQIAQINAAGGIAGVVLTPEEALDLIERGFRKQAAMLAELTND